MSPGHALLQLGFPRAASALFQGEAEIQTSDSRVIYWNHTALTPRVELMS